jgi:hypothetical protein
VGTVGIYRAALLTSAALSLLACLLSVRVPGAPRPQEAAGRAARRSPALPSPAFLAVTLTAGCVLMAYDDILNFAFPLWVTHQTRAPAWICSVALAANTAGIAAFQVAVSRNVGGIRRAGRATLLAAALMALACLALAGSNHTGALPSCLVLLGAAILLTTAELLQSAGAIVLGYDLAPAGSQGAYQGVFAAGYALISCLSPLLLGAVVTHPRSGWPVLALALAAAGCPVPMFAGRAATAAAPMSEAPVHPA